MTLSYLTGTAQSQDLVAAVKQAILASSDWAHLQLTTGTAATTLSSAYTAGGTTISTAASIPSGSIIVTPANEVRRTTAVSGAGPFTVTLASAFANNISNGATISVGTYCKATTTRGAQMAVDLADSAIDTQHMSIGVYTSHDGTTAGNKISRFLYFKRTSGAGTNVCYWRVAAGKEWLYFDIEGPKATETGADSSTAGSWRQCFALNDVVPYSAGDSTAVVCCIGNPTASTSAPSSNNALVSVSKNRAATLQWVNAWLRTLAFPGDGFLGAMTNWWTNPDQDADFDSAPFVIFEQTDGRRGRLGNMFWGGFTGTAFIFSDPAANVEGHQVTYGGNTYTAFRPFKTDGTTTSVGYGFGIVVNQAVPTYGPLIYVPTA